MDEVKNAIYDKLYANSAIAAAVGTRIYRGMAPQGATHPLITFQQIGGGLVTETPIDDADLLYLVQAISIVSDKEAETIAGHIVTALHRQTLTVSGWENTWTAVSGVLDTVELDTGSGSRSFHAGRQARIRLSK